VYHILGKPSPEVQRAVHALPLKPLPPYGTPSALLLDDALFDLDADMSAAAGCLDALPRTTERLLGKEMPKQPVTVPLRAIQGVSDAQIDVGRRRWVYPNLLAFGQDLDNPQVGDYTRDCTRFVVPFLAAGGRMVFSLHERAWDGTLYLNPNGMEGAINAPGAHRFAALMRYTDEAGLDLILRGTLNERWSINHTVTEQILSACRVLFLGFDIAHMPSLRDALLRADIPHAIVSSPHQTIASVTAPHQAAVSPAERIILVLSMQHRGARIVADWLVKTVPSPSLFDATAYLRQRLATTPSTPAYRASP